MQYVGRTGSQVRLFPSPPAPGELEFSPSYVLGQRAMQVSDPMDVVRAFYQAVNRSDLDAITALYHPDCVVEHVFTSDADVYEGREIVRQKWAAEFERYAGALGDGRRIAVDRVAGIETGWGWVRADWSTTVTDGAGPATVESSGHSHFWLE